MRTKPYSVAQAGINLATTLLRNSVDCYVVVATSGTILQLAKEIGANKHLRQINKMMHLMCIQFPES